MSASKPELAIPEELQIVSGEFLKELTGYELPTKQAECLRQHSIFYVQGKSGEVRTTLAWIKEAARRDPTKQTEDGFDLQGLDD